MPQLRRIYPELKAREAELLQIGPELPAAARQVLPRLSATGPEVPYLSDRGWEVHLRYGLRRLGGRDRIETYLKSAVEFVVSAPRPLAPAELGSDLAGNVLEQGVFVVDREGRIAYAFVTTPAGRLPPGDELLAAVDRAG